ncbi:MAG: tyrosine-type recombinase/integrase [Verrucomicrobiota bacterium]
MKLKGLYQKHGIYYFQAPQVKGYRPPPVSLKTKDLTIATTRYFDELKKSERNLKAGRFTLELTRYLNDRLTHGYHTEETSVRTGESLENFALEMLGSGAMVSEIDEKLVAKWVAALQERKLATATLHGYVGRLSGFCSWAVKEGLLAENPCASVRLPRTIDTKAERYCTREERDRLIQNVERDDLALILWLGFYAGMRIKEIIMAETDWIDLHGRVVTIQNTDVFTVKDKSRRMVRMSDRLHEFLTGYMELRKSMDCCEDNEFLLRPDKALGAKIRGRSGKATKKWRYRWDPKYPFKKYTKAQGLEWVGVHTMRHTFATLHAIAGTPLAMIAHEMGDDEKTTFKNYVGYSRNSDHANALD